MIPNNLHADIEQLARNAICSILDGHPPNGTVAEELGPYAECYAEMKLAFEQGGTDASRRVYAAFAKHDGAIAAIRSGDPKGAHRKWSVADLYDATFPVPKFIVPDLLTSGLGMLAARPKIGKSWFGLQMATAVGSGGMIFGKPVELGWVLYLALEDSPRRIRERLLRQKAPANAQIDFFYQWNPLAGAGIDDLATELERGNYTFVVIDTLARALGFVDPNKQAENTKYLGELQRMAMDRDLTMLLIDHHRKGASGDGGGDVIDDVLGATGKSGVLDVSLGLYRKRGERTATLKVTGRDIDEQELSVKFDTTTCCWQMADGAGEVQEDSLQSKIVDTFRTLGGTSTLTTVAEILGKKTSNLQPEFAELELKGVLRRGEKIGRTVPYTLVKV